MKFKLFFSAVLLFVFACKKTTLPNIGIDIQSPKEGIIIQFNGSATRTYPVKINIRSEKQLSKVEYKITNTANNAQISAYLEDDYRNGEKDILLEINENMPAGTASIDAKIVAVVTDVTGFVSTKTNNFKLVP